MSTPDVSAFQNNGAFQLAEEGGFQTQFFGMWNPTPPGGGSFDPIDPPGGVWTPTPQPGDPWTPQRRTSG